MTPQLAKRIGAFFLRFALAYAVAIVLWSAVGGAYRAFYCGVGNIVFGGGQASARFEAAPPNPADLDVKITLTTPAAPGATGTMGNNSRFVGYLPTISLIAFVLATPIPWRRRRKALLFGLLFVQLLVIVRMALPIVREFSKETAIQAYHLGSFGQAVLDLGLRALLHAPASWFIGPILIWAAVAFRREDWELVAAPAPDANRPDGADDADDAKESA